MVDDCRNRFWLLGKDILGESRRRSVVPLWKNQESERSERTRLSGGFTGRPRCDAARDLLGQLFQLLASPALGGAQCGRVGFVPALLLAIGTHRFGVIRLPTIRQ